MDHACHRCGATIEEGVPFCPQCGAPQIRVAGSSVPSEEPTFSPGTPGEIQPPAQPVPLATTDSAINWSKGVPAAALAGLLMAVVTVIPVLGAGCCLWILGGGALAVRFYQSRQPARLSRGMGARLGLLAGLLGFCLFGILKTVWIVVRHQGPTIRSQLRQAVEQAASRNSDPQATQILLSPTGMALMVTAIVAAALVAFLLFGMGGGALGASLWGKRQQGP